MAKRRRRSGGGGGALARQARRYGKIQTAPERATVKSDLRQNKRDRGLQIRSNNSLFAALQEAIGNASSATAGVPGMSAQDKATALGELARRHLDAAGGAALARSVIETKYEQGRKEGQDRLRELAGRSGTIAAEKLSELKQQKSDRRIERGKLKVEQGQLKVAQEGVGIDRAKLALENRQFALDKYIKNQELTIDLIKASGESGKVVQKIKQGFNTALAKLRSSTYTPPGGTSSDKLPVTPSYVRAHRGHIVDSIAASTDLKGNRTLAEGVVQRYLGESPSGAVARYMSRTGITFAGFRPPGRRRPGPYAGARPGLGR